MKRKLLDWLYTFLAGTVILFVVGAGWLIYEFKIKEPAVVLAVEVDWPRAKTHQVLPGDSLWAIASEYYPGMHTGEMVHEIRVLNGLASATIYPYEVIKLPEVE